MRRTFAILIAAFIVFAVPSQAGAVSMKTTRFVASFEGFLPCVYADPAGNATIGYGHLLHLGAPTKKDRKKWGCLSKGQGLKLLKADLRATQQEVLADIRGATVSPLMVTALDSFAFNLGAGVLGPSTRKGKKGTTNIALHVKQGKYRVAAKEMLLYDGIIVHGKRYVLEGLKIRRQKEAHLMIRGIAELKPCSKNCTGDGHGGGLSPS